MRTATQKGYALSLLAALAWAGTAPGLAYLLKTYAVPSLTLALWRDIFATAACLLGLTLLRPALLRVRREDLGWLALTGVISIGVYHALWLWSVLLNGAAVAVVLIYLYPAFVTIGGKLLFGERVGRAHSAGIALAVIGCALVVRVYDPAVFRLNWLGAAIGVLTAITHSVYVLSSQRAVSSYSPWTTLTYTMLFGSLTLAVMALLIAPTQLLAIGTTPTPWLIAAGLAIGPTLGGYALFTMALKHIPGRTAGLIAVIEAPIGTLIAVVLLGERLEWQQVAGIALILGAIALPQLGSLARRRRGADIIDAAAQRA